MKTDKRDFYDALAIGALIAGMVYIITRTVLLTYAHYNGIETFFAVLLIASELFIGVHSFGYILNVLSIIRREKKEEPSVPALKEFPSVAIFITARHEPKELLEETFSAATKMNYPNKTVYFLDDSSEEKYKREAQELKEKYGLVLFSRSIRHGAKAGIINDCLKTIGQKYIAFFDADSYPIPEFLNAIIPIIENDEKLAFVQSPQFYSNLEGNRIVRSAALQQAVFYEYICEAKSNQGAIYCCGTNVVMRTEALKEVGGFDESTVTEDFATSLKFHIMGFKSLYFNHVYTFGMGPVDLRGYFTQQYRWATGTISVFKKAAWQFLTRPFSLRPLQWWEYFLSGTFYMIGFAFFFLMICPIVYLLFKIPSFFARAEVYFLAFIPYFTLSLSVFYTMLKNRNYKIKDLILGQLLGVISFPVHMAAAFSALSGIKVKFGITGKSGHRTLSYLELWPQILMLVLNFTAIVWGINRFVYERDIAILVNGFWTLYYCVILSSVFYFNQKDTTELACKIPFKGSKFKYQILEEGRKTGVLSESIWKNCFGIFLPEKLDPGTVILLKVYLPKNKEEIIFKANVVWSSDRKTHEGFKTALGIVAISGQDESKLFNIMRV